MDELFGDIYLSTVSLEKGIMSKEDPFLGDNVRDNISVESNVVSYNSDNVIHTKSENDQERLAINDLPNTKVTDDILLTPLAGDDGFYDASMNITSSKENLWCPPFSSLIMFAMIIFVLFKLPALKRLFKLKQDSQSYLPYHQTNNKPSAD
ncbi:hypothetical protein BDF14DRAFT_1849321 [Spinellus fusiger]|nr:hypothetical protein BDF14DRAFT_1849321 [Spinellus fusiger]